MLNKRIKNLELLALARQHQKNFNRDYRLQKKGIYEQSEEMFKPLLDKQNDVLALLNNKQNKVLAVESSESTAQKVILPPVAKVASNNSFFILHSETDNDVLFKLSQRSSPQLKMNKKTNDIAILSDPPIPIKNTEGLSELLFNKLNVNLDKVTENDVRDYINIYSELNEKPGESKRIKNIAQHFGLTNELKESNKRSKTTEVAQHNQGQVITIPNNPKELWERLQVLNAASEEGHNNSLDERSAILDKLLNLKQITAKEYKRFLNNKNKIFSPIKL